MLYARTWDAHDVLMYSSQAQDLPNETGLDFTESPLESIKSRSSDVYNMLPSHLGEPAELRPTKPPPSTQFGKRPLQPPSFLHGIQ